MRRSIWLVAGRFGLLQKFSASAGVFETWERSFLQEGDESKLPLSFRRKSFDRDQGVLSGCELCLHVHACL